MKRALYVACLCAACQASGGGSDDAGTQGSDGGDATGDDDGPTGGPADGSSSGASTTGGADDAVDGSTGGPEQDACAPGPAPTLAVGHGDEAFSAFEDGPATIVYGVQGGFHIVIGLRATRLDMTDAAVARLTGTVDGQEVGSSAPYAFFECVEGGTVEEALGMLLIWDVNPDVLHGKTATVGVEVTDFAGTVVTATGEVSLVDPMQG